MSDIDLFSTKYRRGGLSIADYIDASGDCWEWTGTTDTLGYGKVYARSVQRSVHRLVWETLVGPIPDGFQVDHLCRNTGCCNPDHLEPVTPKENVRRSMGANTNKNKTHCAHGHPFSGENLYQYKKERRCKECGRNAVKRMRRRQHV